MGATSKRTSKTIYSIVGKTIRKRVGKEESDNRDVIKRTTARGDEIYEQVFTEINGTIRDVDIYEHKEYGEFININFDDGIDEFTLSIPASSSNGTKFLTRLPNVNLAEPVEIVPYQFEGDDGKEIRGINIYQGDGFKTKIPPYFTRKTPNGMPSVDEKEWGEMSKKQKSRFMDEVSEWLMGYMKDNIKFKPQTDAAGNEKIKEKERSQEAVGDDDLPF